MTANQQAATAAKVFVREFVNNYGWPTKILTDQGQTFNGKLFTALCKEAKILKLRTSPYHPQTNGQPERFNRTLMTMLGTLPEDKKSKLARLGLHPLPCIQLHCHQSHRI